MSTELGRERNEWKRILDHKRYLQRHHQPYDEKVKPNLNIKITKAQEH
jgi:hypothetical protein